MCLVICIAGLARLVTFHVRPIVVHNRHPLICNTNSRYQPSPLPPLPPHSLSPTTLPPTSPNTLPHSLPLSCHTPSLSLPPHSLTLSLSTLSPSFPPLSPSLPDMSAQELAFGEYLGAYSEKEYTNAGQVMKSTGKILEMEAKARSATLCKVVQLTIHPPCVYTD